MQDYLYSSVSIVAIAIHLILNFDLLTGRGTQISKARQYRGFLLSILAYYITDVGWGLIAGLGWTRVLYYETILYFLALSAVILTWCRFIVVFLELDGWSARLLSLAGQMLLAFNVVGLAVNHFNGCFH